MAGHRNALAAQLPDVSVTGRPLATADNLETILSLAGVEVHLVGQWHSLEFTTPATLYLNRSPMTARQAWVRGECARFGMPVRDMDDFLTMIAAKNYHRARGAA